MLPQLWIFARLLGDGQHLNQHPGTHRPAPRAAQGGWKGAG